MPTPLDLLFDPITLTMLAMFAALALAERLFPGRPLPRVPGWQARGLAVFAVYFLLSSYLPLLWADALAPLQFFDLSGWPTGAAAALGLLVYELFAYAYHRGMHSVDAWFRVSHQMHHSAERLDTYGAFWFSPLDMIGWTVLGSLALTVVVGITPEAATTVLYVTTFLSVFQHANVRTPHWLGYIVQRPESHSRHHERGVHAGNYADLPIFDILFGTFYNPRDFAPAAGFYEGASDRVGEMLRWIDVAMPREAEAYARAA